ncbi:cytosolic 5'-nucleotidase 3 [Tribolium madens]|uniref:cytosolic 5'-nucleotidase 3 n=1 Tax=Tribolium madens TaxID=41895 RepID=UPI001CF743E9|nr:cytosolic 5'-nucleotidase 3 [Tribolium madens]
MEISALTTKFDPSCQTDSTRRLYSRLEAMARNFVKEIKELNKTYVHIKDPEKLNAKLNGIINDGFQQLQVVSDFDQTLTKQHENGKRHKSSFRIFECCPSVTEQYLEKTNALTEKYFPLEYDPNISEEEKRKLMEEWWLQSEKILCGLTVSCKEIDEAVAKAGSSLRDGTKDLFQALQSQDVPILVFSAGLGNIVVSVLKNQNVYLPNVKVISNFLKYDESGTIEGFTGPLIHVLNKNEFAIKNTEYFDLVKNRNNVILLGDSLGDAKMADGMAHANYVLKIGFIYEKIEGNLPAYMDTFDIVLEDDQTMDVIRAIINLIK